jgi:hypothetical protein
MKAASVKKSTLLAALALASSGASAMTYVMPEDSALLAQADGVLVGTVTGEATAGAPRGLPQVRHRVVVDRVIAGRLARAEVALELPGTAPGSGVRAFIPGIPSLKAGDRVLVFFDQRGNGTVAPAELSLGLFFEATDAAGQKSYVRQLEGGHALNKAQAEQGSRKRDGAKFERWIRRAAAGVRGTADYFVTESKYTLAPSGFPDALPTRWFEFDANQSISVRAVSNGMAGATFDEFAAVTAALAAWNNDAGSRILLNYGGTVASDPGNNSTNQINAVIWDDPGADISGSYNCNGGGVLAIGGSFASSNTGVVGGQTFHRNVESFVITQDGAACIYNGHGGLDGAEILGHEIGHTLGFGHSCESGNCGAAGSVADAALMRSFVHRDGRGAVLGIDDMAVAALVYPAPGGGGAGVLLRNGFE